CTCRSSLCRRTSDRGTEQEVDVEKQPADAADETAEIAEPVADSSEEEADVSVQSTDVPDEIPDHIRPAKTIRPVTGKPFKSTTSLPRTTTSEQKVKGLNIGLHYILENIKRKLKYRKSVPNELLIKVFVLSSKIEQSGGEVFPVNKDGMKVISDLLPSSYKNSICSA
ncbi:uncharacterized protein TNCT_644171, partial [Trichonephila clavata]